MTNLKLSSKMHLFIIISSVVIAIGLAIGLICQFVANGFFNYGAEFKSYNTIEVNYAYVECSDECDVIKICDSAFDKAGVSYYACTSGDTDEGGRVIFKFAKSVDEEKLTSTIDAIHNGFKAYIQSNLDKGSAEINLNEVLSNAAFHSLEAELNGGKVLTFASIAIASAVALQLLYFIIRYKLTMGLAALLASIHNLAIYVSLLAITRVPVGISAVAFAALTVLVTMISCGFYFDRCRRNLKKEKYEKTGNEDLSDISINESFKSILYPVVGIATAAVVFFVLLSISAMSVLTILSPVVAAIFSVASALYCTAFFTPSVYPRIKSIGDKVKARSKNKKQ